MSHTSNDINYIGCSERTLIRHSFYSRNFLRKNCATCREKSRRAVPRTEKSDKPAQWTLCTSDIFFSTKFPEEIYAPATNVDPSHFEINTSM
jgi:hypothetical protein